MKKSDDNPPIKTVDEYIALLPEAQQLALENVRQIIKTVAPQAEEVISYQIPMYKYKGMLVGFAAFKDHCSFVGGNGSSIEKFKDELTAYKFAKSVIHFTPEKPLPNEFIERFVRTRVAENEGKKTKK